MRELSGREIVLRRLAANGLSAPFGQALDCVRALAGVQSQFQQWAEVSIMNRCGGEVSMRELAALYREHGIINLWGQRHTLHMYVKEDWDAICALYEPLLAAKNNVQKSFPEDFVWLLDRLAAECAPGQPLPKARIREIIEERMQGRQAEVEYFVGMLVGACCLRGIFCGVPEKPGIKYFVGRGRVCAEPWRPDPERASAALQDFMLRYFKHYGPATLADFSHWSGLAQLAAKGALAKVRDRLELYTHAGREYFAHGSPEGAPPENCVFLLGKFDPLFVSYKHKDWTIPGNLQKQVWRSAGWVEAVLLDGDKAVGTWRHTLKGSKMSVEVSQFAKLSAATRKQTAARAERLAEFWEKRLDALNWVQAS